jgi:hypothetical protein
MFRGQMEHKVASRLSIPVNDFKALVKKPSVAPTPTSPAQVDVVRGHDIAMISMLALRDDDSRRFILEQNWRDVLEQTPGSELLIRVLEHEIRPDDTASLNAFMSKLPAADESVVSAWLMQKMPTHPIEVTRNWWKGLWSAALRRQLAIAEGQITLPNLSTGEVVNLQKQILDLRGQLHELSQPAGQAGN